MQIGLVNVFANCLSLSERNVFYQNFIKILAQAMQFLFKLSFSNITLSEMNTGSLEFAAFKNLKKPWHK